MKSQEKQKAIELREKPALKLKEEPIRNMGVCKLTVYRTDIVQHIFGAIQEYGGFNTDYCLR